MSAEIPFDQVLDAKKLRCALIINAKKAVGSLSRGQVLKVEAMDDVSKNEITVWAKKTGNEMLKMEEEAGIYTCYIKKPNK
jgi:tRNA 2-thiouridine synthesizing protein A